MPNYAVPAPDDAPTGGYAVPAPDDPGGQAGGWQSQVKPTQTYNGKQSVQRSDGAVWYGPEQGNTGQAGWFDAKGNRAGNAPGQAYSAGIGRTAGNTGLAAMAGFGSPLEAGIRVYGNLGGALREGTGFDLPWSQEASNFAQDQARYRQGLTQGGHGVPEAGNALGTMASQIGLANILPTAGLASQAGNYAAPATTALGRIGQAAGAGAAAGVPYGMQAALTTPPDQGVSYPQHMAGNLQGAMEMSAAIPGGLSAIGEGIEGAGQDIRRALGSPAERQAALDLAAKIRTATGAEPSLGESLQNPNLQHVENATEYVPFGGRGNQLKSANTAMQSALQAETDAHAPALGPTGAGDVISNSAKAALAAKRAPAIQLYNEVREGMANASPRDETTGLPLNDDGTVTLYHGTTREGAATIQSSGKLKSSGEPDVYLTTAQEGTGYGDGTVVPVRVDPSKSVLDDEFPNGRQDFRIPMKNSRASVPVQVGEGTRAPLRPTVDNTLAAYDEAIAQESGISGKVITDPDSPGGTSKLASGETAPDYKSLEKMQDRQQSIAANGFNAPSQEAQDVAHYRSGIGKAMGSDLQATANAVDPALGDKYKQANKIYSESYAYDPNASTDWQGAQQRSMNRTIHGAEGTIQSLPDNLLKSNNPDVATHAFDALDDTGKNAVKAEV